MNRTEYELPIDIDDVYSGKHHRLIDVEFDSLNDVLFFTIRAPLLELTEFDLFRLHPYPVLQNCPGKILSAYVQPNADYLLLSQNKGGYSPIHQAELDNCHQLGNILACKSNFVISQSHVDPICEVDLLFNVSGSGFPANCEIKVNTNYSPFIKQLETTNRWIYSLPHLEEVSGTYQGRTVYIDTIEGTGVISLFDSDYAIRISKSDLIGSDDVNRPTDFQLQSTFVLNLTKILPNACEFEFPIQPSPSSHSINQIISEYSLKDIMSKLHDSPSHYLSGLVVYLLFGLLLIIIIFVGYLLTVIGYRSPNSRQNIQSDRDCQGYRNTEEVIDPTSDTVDTVSEVPPREPVYDTPSSTITPSSLFVIEEDPREEEAEIYVQMKNLRRTLGEYQNLFTEEIACDFQL